MATDYSHFGDYTPEDEAWLTESWPVTVDERCTACWVLDGRGKWEFWPCPKHASKGAV